MKDQKRPLFAAIVHGLFNASGLTLLFVYCIYQNGPIAGLIALLLAALCGLAMIYNEVKDTQVPKWLGALHGVLSLTGLVLLLIFALGH